MTTLYIKTHNVTGLKYFGKTTKEDAHKYRGSGKYWKNHIKKYSYDVTTEIYAQFDETDDIQRLILVETALMFSEENDIVESKEWANLKPENGLDGVIVGSKRSDETKAKMSAAKIGKFRSDETKAKISEANTGKTRSDETKAKLSEAQIGKTLSDETKVKMSSAQIGKTRSDETKAKISENGKNRKGKIFINNKLKNKMIKPEEFPEYERLGWLKGRISFKN